MISVAVVPSGWVTPMLSGPTKFKRGATQVKEVELLKFTRVQATPPTLTVAPVWKLLPVSVSGGTPSPTPGPEFGEAEVIVTAATVVRVRLNGVDPAPLVPVRV